ncbi:hypothetical protein [Aquamicrobium soli]|uniref:DNA-binding protein n=1 Tax=Aquamicrobium soli TaxID=1811518 RepID=A0ABV7K7T6_9HYPH
MTETPRAPQINGMQRLSTKQTLAVLGLTHRNSLRDRIAKGQLTPIVDRGRNYYDKEQVERLARNEPSKSRLAIDAGLPVAKGFEHITVEEFEDSVREAKRLKQSAHLEDPYSED